jgi:hypothetical protein
VSLLLLLLLLLLLRLPLLLLPLLLTMQPLKLLPLLPLLLQLPPPLLLLLPMLVLLLLLPPTLGRVTAKRGTSPLRVFQSMGLMDAAQVSRRTAASQPISTRAVERQRLKQRPQAALLCFILLLWCCVHARAGLPNKLECAAACTASPVRCWLCALLLLLLLLSARVAPHQPLL